MNLTNLFNFDSENGFSLRASHSIRYKISSVKKQALNWEADIQLKPGIMDTASENRLYQELLEVWQVDAMSNKQLFEYIVQENSYAIESIREIKSHRTTSPTSEELTWKSKLEAMTFYWPDGVTLQEVIAVLSFDDKDRPSPVRVQRLIKANGKRKKNQRKSESSINNHHSSH